MGCRKNKRMIVPDGLLDWAWAVITGFGAVIWGMLHKRIDKVEALSMAHTNELRAEHEKRIAGIGSEVDRQRDVSAKIFDKLDAMSKESADRHMSLLTALHQGLSGKADK